MSSSAFLDIHMFQIDDRGKETAVIQSIINQTTIAS